MYQKQEIIIKKRYDENYEDYEMSEESYDFYYGYVLLYVQTIEAMTVLSENTDKPFIKGKITQTENDDELHIIIEEDWETYYEAASCNGNSAFSDKIAELLCDGAMIAKRYSAVSDSLGDDVRYRCIGRYLDPMENNNGAVMVYDNENKKYRKYDYYQNNNFSGKKITTDEIADKKWYPASPDLFWWFIGPVDEEKYSEDEWIEDKNSAFKTDKNKYSDLVQEFCEYMGGEPDMQFSADNSYAYDECSIRYFSSGMNDGMSKNEIAELICEMEQCSRNVIAVQEKSCRLNDIDPSEYINDSFTGNMFFISDDYEILYAASDVTDEKGLRTGDISLYYKKYI